MKKRLGSILLLSLIHFKLQAGALKEIKYALLTGHAQLAKVLIRKAKHSHLKVTPVIFLRYGAISDFINGDYKRSLLQLEDKLFKVDENFAPVCHLKVLNMMILNKEHVRIKKNWDRCYRLALQTEDDNQVWFNQFVNFYLKPNETSQLLSSQDDQILGILRLQYFQNYLKNLLPPASDIGQKLQEGSDYQVLRSHSYFKKRNYQLLLKNLENREDFQSLVIKGSLLIKLNKWKEAEKLLKLALKKRNYSTEVANRLFLLSWKQEKWAEALTYLEMSSYNKIKKNLWGSFIFAKTNQRRMLDNGLYVLEKNYYSKRDYLDLLNFNAILLESPQDLPSFELTCEIKGIQECQFYSRAIHKNDLNDYFNSYLGLKRGPKDLLKRKKQQETLYIDPAEIDKLDIKENL